MTTTTTAPERCRDCGTVETDGSLCHLTDGSFLCCTCWNAEVGRGRAERKVQLAARPKCEHCHKQPGAWHVGTDRVLLCGPCKRRAVENGPKMWLLFGTPPSDRQTVMEALA